MVEPWFHGRFCYGNPVLVKVDKSPEVVEWFSKSGSKINTYTRSIRTARSALELSDYSEMHAGEEKGRNYCKRGPCSEKMWGPLIYEHPVTPPDCFHPTCTVVIIDILLRTCAAMHTTIAAAADWRFEARFSKANC